MLAPFFVMWFASGIVLAYVKFPRLTRPERLAAAPALDFSTAKLSPARAAATLRAGEFRLRGTPTGNLALPAPADPAAPVRPRAVRLTQVQGRPAYVFTAGMAQPVVVFADDGSRPGPATPERAVSAAHAFAGGGAPRYLETLQSDQWSVGFELNEHRPLLRVAMGDGAGTEYYVSSVTGEVVRDTRRRERLLNWLGSVPHWIYPHFLRKHPAAWEWVVDILAVAGVVVVLAGIAVGFLRLRRRAARPRTARQCVARWHYFAGLAFGAVALTWVFSGWMSMNPRGFSPFVFPSPTEMFLFSGGPLDLSRFSSVPELPENTVEASLLCYAKQPLVLASSRDGLDSLLPATLGTDPVLPTADAILARVRELMPGVPLAGAAVLTGYDNHYYTRHPEEAAQPLPVVRARFADGKNTWFHIDVKTGRLLDKSTAGSRVFRHLYRGLHSFDWWWLWSRRPLWDIAIVGGSLGGLALSLAGLALALRHLRRTLHLQPFSSPPQTPPPQTPTQ